MDSSLNLDHLELIHYFSTVACRIFSLDNVEALVWQVVVVKFALCYPFLMHLQPLSTPALHHPGIRVS